MRLMGKFGIMHKICSQILYKSAIEKADGIKYIIATKGNEPFNIARSPAGSASQGNVPAP